jgi:hypothetical protein
VSQEPISLTTLLTFILQTIFAVNAGSNTLSMLSISAADPTKLSLVGKPVRVPGEFTTTVAASAKHNIVCVGTTGAIAGIACSRFSPCGLGPMDALRPFDLGQTTPPVGPTNTVSQVFFSADESMLFATVKGDPANNNTGFFSAFPVQRANNASARNRPASSSSSISRVEQRSSPNNTAVLFGSQPIPGPGSPNQKSHAVFATDASFGAAILSVDPATGYASTVATGKIAGQKATCWATISPATGTAFVTDVAVNRLVEVDVRDARVLSELDLAAAGSPDPGLIDLRAAGDFIYALSPGNGTTDAAVTVVSVGGGSAAKMVQRLGLGSMAVGRNAMGMAVLV